MLYVQSTFKGSAPNRVNVTCLRGKRHRRTLGIVGDFNQIPRLIDA
jgi:hypothetical protein